jgi:hypothetical protein
MREGTDATACPPPRAEVSSETSRMPASVVKDYARYLGGSLSCRARSRPALHLRGGPVAAATPWASMARACDGTGASAGARGANSRAQHWQGAGGAPTDRDVESRMGVRREPPPAAARRPPAAAQCADGPAPSRLDSDRLQSAEPRIYARANGRPAARHHRHSGGAPFHRGPGLSASTRSLLGFRV